MTGTIAILNPAVAPAEPGAPTRRVARALRGATVGFVDNTKPNFRELADDIGELLRKHHGVAAIFRYGKHLASMPAGDRVIEELAATCDIAITGSGD